MQTIPRGGRQETPQPDEHDALIGYLSRAAVVTAAAGAAVDEHDPSKGAVVPIGLVTDGTLVWPMEVRYYYQTYGGGIDATVLDSARRHGFAMPAISAADLATIRTQVLTASPTASDDDYADIRGDAPDPFG